MHRLELQAHSLARRQALRWLSAVCGAAAGAAGGPGLAQAATDPASGLCGSAPPPPYPPPERPALVQSWLLDGRQDGPTPDCSGLRHRDGELLVRVTASYHAPGELDAQLARFGAVSRLKGARYWSFSERQRQLLFSEAYAVDQPASRSPRADYSAAELRSGQELYFVHSDNRSSKLAPYGLTLLKAGEQGFVLRVENIDDLRFMGLTLVASREMQWVVSIKRLAPGLWGYVGLLGLRRLRLAPAEQHRLSNLSRCVAMFDLLAGRQTEIESYR